MSPIKLNGIVLYSTSETAEILQRTPDGIRKLIYGGKLKARSVGGRLYVLKEDLLEFLEGVPVSGISKKKRKRNYLG